LSRRFDRSSKRTSWTMHRYLTKRCPLVSERFRPGSGRGRSVVGHLYKTESTEHPILSGVDHPGFNGGSFRYLVVVLAGGGPGTHNSRHSAT
jgi:hypothetical protein